MKIGLVAEGLHDYPIIRELIEGIASEKGLGPIDFVELQPKLDATMSATGGGFGPVIGWCKSNTGPKLSAYLDAPFFEGEERYDMIVIHLDGDAVHDCASHSTINIPAGVLGPTDRVKLLGSMIEEWLSPSVEHKRQLRNAIPVMQTESWIIAALSSNSHAWEEVAAKQIFLNEFHALGQTKAQRYKQAAKNMYASVANLRQNCSSYVEFEGAVFP